MTSSPLAQQKTSFASEFIGKPSIKDTIEALGVPHTEIDLILVDGESVGFDYQMRGGERIAVYPVFESFDIAGLIHLQPLRQTKFVELSLTQRRIILTRDKGILKYRVVTHAYWVRSDDPVKQLKEVIRRFQLENSFRPMSRCSACNGSFRRADKSVLQARLPADTLQYF